MFEGALWLLQEGSPWTPAQQWWRCRGKLGVWADSEGRAKDWEREVRTVENDCRASGLGSYRMGFPFAEMGTGRKEQLGTKIRMLRPVC